MLLLASKSVVLLFGKLLPSKHQREHSLEKYSPHLFSAASHICFRFAAGGEMGCVMQVYGHSRCPYISTHIHTEYRRLNLLGFTEMRHWASEKYRTICNNGFHSTCKEPGFVLILHRSVTRRALLLSVSVQ